MTQENKRITVSDVLAYRKAISKGDETFFKGMDADRLEKLEESSKEWDLLDKKFKLVLPSFEKSSFSKIDTNLGDGSLKENLRVIRGPDFKLSPSKSEIILEKMNSRSEREELQPWYKKYKREFIAAGIAAGISIILFLGENCGIMYNKDPHFLRGVK